MAAVALTAPLLQSLQMAAVFEPAGPVTSMDFSPSGEHLITASSDESLVLYDCLQGRCGVVFLISPPRGGSHFRANQRETHAV
jgi:WD40 repeat protein